MWVGVGVGGRRDGGGLDGGGMGMGRAGWGGMGMVRESSSQVVPIPDSDCRLGCDT